MCAIKTKDEREREREILRVKDVMISEYNQQHWPHQW